MAGRINGRNGTPKSPPDEDIEAIIRALGNRLSDGEASRLRGVFYRKFRAELGTEVDYEFKFLSIFTIRHTARIGPGHTRLRFLVLLIPALMLVLAVGGAIALVWLLGPRLRL